MALKKEHVKAVTKEQLRALIQELAAALAEADHDLKGLKFAYTKHNMLRHSAGDQWGGLLKEVGLEANYLELMKQVELALYPSVFAKLFVALREQKERVSADADIIKECLDKHNRLLSDVLAELNEKGSNATGDVLLEKAFHSLDLGDTGTNDTDEINAIAYKGLLQWAEKELTKNRQQQEEQVDIGAVQDRVTPAPATKLGSPWVGRVLWPVTTMCLAMSAFGFVVMTDKMSLILAWGVLAIVGLAMMTGASVWQGKRNAQRKRMRLLEQRQQPGPQASGDDSVKPESQK